MLNGLGRHVGAAEGAITIGDHLDVDGAAVCILWAPGKQCSRGQKRPHGLSVRPLLDQVLSAPFPFSIYTPTPRPSH